MKELGLAPDSTRYVLLQTGGAVELCVLDLCLEVISLDMTLLASSVLPSRELQLALFACVGRSPWPHAQEECWKARGA